MKEEDIVEDWLKASIESKQAYSILWATYLQPDKESLYRIYPKRTCVTSAMQVIKQKSGWWTEYEEIISPKVVCRKWNENQDFM